MNEATVRRAGTLCGLSRRFTPATGTNYNRVIPRAVSGAQRVGGDGE